MADTEDAIVPCLVAVPTVMASDAAISSLEEILNDMKSGDSCGFAICATGKDYASWRSWHAPTREDCISLIGQLSLLQRMLMDDYETR
jgi:hypothetical protein